MVLTSWPLRANAYNFNDHVEDDDNTAQFYGGSTGQSLTDSSELGDYDNGQKRISALNALLPISTCFECRKVRFELYATNGCYSW